MTGTFQSFGFDFSTGKPTITLSINERQEAVKAYENLKNCEKLNVLIKKYREKRSLDANAYFWVLADKLAEKIGTSKEAIYKSYVKDIGGNSEVVCVKNKAVDKLCEGWEHNGLGWQTDQFPSKIDGCTNIILYYGSSTYDKKQMGQLIDFVVADCKEQEIETMTPDELCKLKDAWGHG